MSDNNLYFLKAILYILGINILIYILPYPWGFLSFLGITAWSLYMLWRQTR